MIGSRIMVSTFRTLVFAVAAILVPVAVPLPAVAAEAAEFENWQHARQLVFVTTPSFAGSQRAAPTPSPG